MDVEFAIPPATMRTGMDANEEAFGLFEKDVSCRLHLRMERNDVFLSGQAGTSIHPVCARCGEEFDSPMKVRLDLTCSPQKPRAGADSYQESDEGLVFYTHEKLDLAEIVREQVLLALPIRHLCRPECLGLCSKCGANLNLGPHACES